jgi:response regulator RpfG family c-di-GMP phosphodiesterase
MQPKKIRSLFHIPVIYLTAHADESTLQRARVSEPFGYIVKPFRERDLHIAIRFALYKGMMEVERNALVRQLQDALARVKTVSGLIPICVSCKKIRYDEGFWDQVESFISSHTDAELTHELCPECAKKNAPDFDCRK